MARGRDRERKPVSARRRVEQHDAGGRTSVKLPEGVTFFSVKKEGTVRLDILPFVAGKGNPYADQGEYHYERTYFAHRGIGANNDTYVCPAKTFGKRCPICEHRMSLDRSVDEDLVKSLVPKERQLFIVWDHADKEAGVKCWDVSNFLFGKHLDAKIRNADEGEYDYFADPEKGFTLKIGSEKGVFNGNEFYTSSDIEFKARKDSIPAEILDACPCLDECLIEVDYDKLKKIFLQTPDDEDEEENKKEKSRVPSKKKPPPPDEDEDEDEDDEEGDDEDDDDQDEEEEEDADESDDDKEDEEEEKPVKGKSKKQPTAKELGIKEGTMVMYKRLECEVTRVSGDGTSLMLEDEDGETYKAISPSDVKLMEEEEPDEDEEPEEKPAKRGVGRPRKAE